MVLDAVGSKQFTSRVEHDQRGSEGQPKLNHPLVSRHHFSFEINYSLSRFSVETYKQHILKGGEYIGMIQGLFVEAGAFTAVTIFEQDNKCLVVILKIGCLLE